MLDTSIVSQIVSTAAAEEFDHIANIKDIVAQVKLSHDVAFSWHCTGCRI